MAEYLPVRLERKGSRLGLSFRLDETGGMVHWVEKVYRRLGHGRLGFDMAIRSLKFQDAIGWRWQVYLQIRAE